MTKDQGKAAKPITSHPLFPAVVALWFGALFGLGSLAVRPSLLEDLVLKSHIDLILPAAAPPLGVTSRILLALIMAALGAILGIVLTRRLTRPKVEAYERKRGARDLTTGMQRFRARDAHPDAPARRPISAHEELGGEQVLELAPTSQTGPGMLANRRRALALIEDEPVYVPHELAPLPGEGAVQPLDLATLALSTEPEPEGALSPPQGAVSPAPALDWTNSAPVAAAPQPAPVSSEAAHRDGRQVFGMAPPAAPSDTPRQIFGVVAQDDHLPQEFVKAAGFQTSVFDVAEPSPLFERTASVHASDAAEPDPVVVAFGAEPEPLPSPASLGMTDLAARLGEAMQRRRAQAQTRATAAVAVASEPFAAAELPTALTLPSMPIALAQPDSVEAAPAAVQVFAEVPRFITDPPAADTPAESSQPIVPIARPAAMRPLALDAFLEDDAPFDGASLLPPRHIAMPAPPVAAEPPEDEVTAEDSPASGATDNPYASLLAVAPARQAFVRIEEPEQAASEAIEPVVIFPGQAPLAAGQVTPIAQFGTVTAPTTEDTSFRRFDAPASAGQGQPVAAGTSAAVVDPEAAAQALRAALSNLQRMSGAA